MTFVLFNFDEVGIQRNYYVVSYFALFRMITSDFNMRKSYGNRLKDVS
jgi:hypothetical protein